MQRQMVVLDKYWEKELEKPPGEESDKQPVKGRLDFLIYLLIPILVAETPFRLYSANKMSARKYLKPALKDPRSGCTLKGDPRLVRRAFEILDTHESIVRQDQHLCGAMSDATARAAAGQREDLKRLLLRLEAFDPNGQPLAAFPLERPVINAEDKIERLPVESLPVLVSDIDALESQGLLRPLDAPAPHRYGFDADVDAVENLQRIFDRRTRGYERELNLPPALDSKLRTRADREAKRASHVRLHDAVTGQQILAHEFTRVVRDKDGQRRRLLVTTLDAAGTEELEKLKEIRAALNPDAALDARMKALEGKQGNSSSGGKKLRLVK